MATPDLNKFSNADLQAIADGNLDKVSTRGLYMLSGEKDSGASYDPTSGMSGTEKFLAGAGKGMVDVGRGAREAFLDATGTSFSQSSAAPQGADMHGATRGGAPGRLPEVSNKPESDSLRAEVNESRKLDAPLERTKAGRFGEFVGQLAATAPLAAIPGGAGVVGGAAIGALSGAIQPVGTGENRQSNIVSGALGGAAGSVAGKVLSGVSGAALDSMGRVRPAAQSVAGKAIERGKVIPPSMSERMGGRKPGLFTQLAESVAGKTRTEQEASIFNEESNTAQAREAFGLSHGTSLTKEELGEVRENAGQAYDEVRAVPGVFKPSRKMDQELDGLIGTTTRLAKKHPAIFGNPKIEELINSLKGNTFDTHEAVELTKQLRHDGDLNRLSPEPKTKTFGVVQRRAANMIDGMLESFLKAKGRPEVYDNFRNARKTIAQTYDAEKALTSTNKIDAVKLGKSKKPLSDELNEIAEFGKAFEGAARDTGKRGSRLGPEVSKTEIGAGVVAGAAGHHLGAVKAAVIAGAPWLARKYVLSDMAQKRLLPQTLEQRLLPRVGAQTGATLADLRRPKEEQ